METLTNLLNDLERKMEWNDAVNTKVSQRAVSWHIAHSLQVISKIIEAIESSNPQEYLWQFNFKRTMVGTLGFIPRGLGKAPRSVLPPEHITAEALHEAFNAIRQTIPVLEQLDSNSHFKHPYFGPLNLKQTKKFLALHTKHHLKIIEDIIK